MNPTTEPKNADPQNIGPAPQMPADLDWCLAQAGPAQSGALWRLAEPARQLDANLVRLPAGTGVAAHTEPDLDVLLLVLAGSGSLQTGGDELDLAPHTLIWLPRGARRAISAGPAGLAYLTTHRARPAMTIRLPQDPELLARLEEREDDLGQGGEAACQLARLCPACGAMTDPPAPCPACGREPTA